MKFNEVIKFWFEELTPKQHWVKDEKLDDLIRHRFLDTYQAAIRGELFSWRTEANGRLAEIIVLDQFSRNIFRNRPEAFAGDRVALTLAQEIVYSNQILDLEKSRRAFAIMPFMHSESLVIHDEALRLFSNPELGGSLEFEKKHRDIIVRFGRYPHRNEVLGRASTAEEVEFLKMPGSSF
jgi:uncharacterized protein (DUF924 family)